MAPRHASQHSAPESEAVRRVDNFRDVESPPLARMATNILKAWSRDAQSGTSCSNAVLTTQEVHYCSHAMPAPVIRGSCEIEQKGEAHWIQNDEASTSLGLRSDTRLVDAHV